MSKGLKLILGVLTVFAGLSLLHIQLNIGFGNLARFRDSESEAPRRVGFLPVT